MKLNTRGGSTFGCLISIVVFVALVYVGFLWGYAQYDYETMRQHVVETCRYWSGQGDLSASKVRDDIIRKIDEIGLDIDDENIIVKDEDNMVTVDLWWQVPLKFPGYTYYLEYSIYREAGRP